MAIFYVNISLLLYKQVSTDDITTSKKKKKKKEKNTSVTVEIWTTLKPKHSRYHHI